MSCSLGLSQLPLRSPRAPRGRPDPRRQKEEENVISGQGSAVGSGKGGVRDNTGHARGPAPDARSRIPEPPLGARSRDWVARLSIDSIRAF